MRAAGLLRTSSPSTEDLRYSDRPARPARNTHGVNAMVGPTGSGKSLLVVTMARMYYEGKARDLATGLCACLRPGCDENWTVYANMRATATKEKGAWTRPLDLAADLMSGDAELSHAIIILDEGYQSVDARRATRNENVKIANQLAQIRKHDNRLFITAPSFDMIDVRIRQQVKRIYNCWSPDGGRHVCAAVHEMSLGHLPPWMRNQKPQLRRWYTEPSKKYYDSWEQIRDDEDLGSWKVEPGLFVDFEGERVYITHRQLIDQYVVELVEAGIPQVSPAAAAAVIADRINAPVGVGFVRRVLADAGFQKRTGDDGQDTFVLLGDGALSFAQEDLT